MNVATDVNEKEVIGDYLYSVNIIFADDKVIELNNITKQNILLCKEGVSCIDVTDALFNLELLERFKGDETDEIKHIYLRYQCADKRGRMQFPVMTDFPCNMWIDIVNIESSKGKCAEMRVVLKGVVG